MVLSPSGGALSNAQGLQPNHPKNHRLLWVSMAGMGAGPLPVCRGWRRPHTGLAGITCPTPHAKPITSLVNPPLCWHGPCKPRCCVPLSLLPLLPQLHSHLSSPPPALQLRPSLTGAGRAHWVAWLPPWLGTGHSPGDAEPLRAAVLSRFPQAVGCLPEPACISFHLPNESKRGQGRAPETPPAAAALVFVSSPLHSSRYVLIP